MNSELELLQGKWREKGHITNAVEGTEQYMGNSQWVGKLKKLRGSNQWKQMVETHGLCALILKG